MSKISVDLSKAEATIEGDAAVVLAFLVKAELKLANRGPAAIAALGVLVAATEQFLTDADTGNFIAAIQQVKPFVADMKSFIATLK
jgi:hypothetical protein